VRLLIAEPDGALAGLLQERFQRESFSVHLVNSANTLSILAANSVFDLLLIDLSLPGINGLECISMLQARWPDAPIVLVSGTNAVEDRVRALNAGADDLVAKPFAIAELVARVQAILRRRSRPAHDVYSFEDLEINRVSHRVSRKGRDIELSPKEYALLEFLLRNPGRPVSRASIIEQVWRMHSESITNVVDVYVNYLRRKIDAGSDHPLIRTVRGVGYQIGGNHFAG
jgi:DNA-binding response OmpR family regulator